MSLSSFVLATGVLAAIQAAGLALAALVALVLIVAFFGKTMLAGLAFVRGSMVVRGLFLTAARAAAPAVGASLGRAAADRISAPRPRRTL